MKKPTIPVRDGVAAVMLVTVMAACGGTGPTEPRFLDFTGTYAGAWTLAASPDSAGSLVIECPGSVTISVQRSLSLRGTYELQPTSDCVEASGEVNGGGSVVNVVGLAFHVGPAGLVPYAVDLATLAFRALSGCVGVKADTLHDGTIIPQDDTLFRGEIQGGVMDVSTGFNTICPDSVGTPRRVDWWLRFGGS